ncbi:alpha-amylase family glycosyl hydrolase [Nonomuraea rubra]|uniref:alpha-amylase family glycosyl hydrolase n=1 Tax=Nonomuraea rubra TaxID=46180 RepID=UPI0033C40DB4
MYQIYVRSFADANGDGVGDIQGIISRLGHLAALGVDGIWLTPVFASPQFDFGYDVSDYREIHHEFGTIGDMDELLREAHARNIAVILDMILSHTSIEHPWFRAHPERYLWSEERPNNWLSAFGGSAWHFDEKTSRYYYHRYYPEQPHLDWSNPDVRHAMHDVIAFWVERGVDGFRLDSIDGLAVDPQLRDEPRATGTGIAGRENDNWADYWQLEHLHTTNLPQVLDELARLKAAFPATSFLVEADLPRTALKPYLEIADSAFSFEFFRARLDGAAIAPIIDGAGIHGRSAWALSNHDLPRMVSRWGRPRAGIAAMLLLTLPGWAFIYQGDEIGMIDGPGGPVAFDRSGRDAVRHPMQWDATGGFSTAEPWLPMIDPADCNVADQLGDPHSMIELYRALISFRRQLSGPVEVIEASEGELIYRRGSETVQLNFGAGPVRRVEGDVRFSTGRLSSDLLPPDTGVIVRS